MANKETMTPKERWMAAVRMKPVDSLPFWPKLGGNYSAARRAPFDTMTYDEIQAWIGSDQHKHIPTGVKEVRRNTSVAVEKNGDLQTTVYSTPNGSVKLVLQFDAASHSYHPVAHPIKTLEDIAIMNEFYRDMTVELDEEQLATARQQYDSFGQTCVAAIGIGESALMYWVEFLAGIENAHFLLADYADEVEELFEAIHNNLRRRTEIVAENNPADLFYMIENTSTTLISPTQYRRYCLKHLKVYADIVSAAGKSMVLHMCGHLKALLPDINTLDVRAFEAFTSPTLGNTTFADGRKDCPEKCLIGGTNAMLWTKPAETIIGMIEKDLSILPHHRGLVVTSAGVMPPMCEPETIKQVCDWVKAYPARF